jgi:hypothetical protein
MPCKPDCDGPRVAGLPTAGAITGTDAAGLRTDRSCERWCTSLTSVSAALSWRLRRLRRLRRLSNRLRCRRRTNLPPHRCRDVFGPRDDAAVGALDLRRARLRQSPLRDRSFPGSVHLRANSRSHRGRHRRPHVGACAGSGFASATGSESGNAAAGCDFCFGSLTVRGIVSAAPGCGCGSLTVSATRSGATGSGFGFGCGFGCGFRFGYGYGSVTGTESACDRECQRDAMGSETESGSGGERAAREIGRGSDCFASGCETRRHPLDCRRRRRVARRRDSRRDPGPRRARAAKSGARRRAAWAGHGCSSANLGGRPRSETRHPEAQRR